MHAHNPTPTVAGHVEESTPPKPVYKGTCLNGPHAGKELTLPFRRAVLTIGHRKIGTYEYIGGQWHWKGCKAPNLGTPEIQQNRMSRAEQRRAMRAAKRKGA